MKLIRIQSKTVNFETRLKGIRGTETTRPSIEKTVQTILSAVRRRGDQAVLQYTRKFD